MNRTITAAICTLIAAVPLSAAGRLNARDELRQAERARPDAMHGAELFAGCVACHGQRGQGADDGSVPMIAGQHFRVIAKELVDYRHARRWDIRMESVASRHRLSGPQDIADVATYVSLLDPSAQEGVGDGTLVGRGATVFAGHCAGCHGRAAEGSNDRLVPRMAGQHYEYLLRQIYDTADNRRPNMSRDHARLFMDFDLDSIKGVADYLSRLSPATLPPPRD